MNERRRSTGASVAAAVSFAGGAVAVVVAAALAARRGWFRVAVAGESMTPALRPGDFLVLRRGGPPTGERAFGHVVAARAPGGRLVVKRVIGLPGESLRVGTAVQINGRILLEPYAHGATPPHQFRGLNRLGEDEYFLIGDRRDASTDSRDFGPVPRDALAGVAVLRYWPPSRVGRLRPPPRTLAGATPAPGEAAGAPPGIVGASRALARGAGRAGNGHGHAGHRPADPPAAPGPQESGNP